MPHRGSMASGAVLFALIVLLLASAGIRIHGLTVRYPYLNYVDEGHILHPASNMYRERTLDPHHYWHNTLLMTTIDVVVRVVVQFLDDPEVFRARIKYHPWSSSKMSNEERRYGIVDPPIFIVVGRAIVAVCGTLAVLMMFLLLAELLPPWPALAGAAVFASIPVLVRYSHFVVGDVPMMLAYLGVYLATLRWWRTGVTGWLVAAGVASGAACSFKMTGLLATGFPLIHVVLSSLPWLRKLGLAALVIGIAYVSFHVFCPGLFGKDRELIANLAFMNRYYTEHEGSRLTHLLQLLDANRPERFMLGLPLLALSLLGSVGLLTWTETRRATLPIVLYASAFLVLFSRNHFQPFRSMFPLLPLLLLLVVWGLFTLLQRYWPRRPAAATAAFLGALAVLCATQAVGKHREFIAITDTRNVLTQWIADNVPPDRTVTVLDSIQLHPDAARLTGASIQTASLADREILLGADWLVLPTFEADAKTEREELADLTRELIAQGRKIVWRRGNRDISSAASFSRPPRMRLQVYGPAARSTQQR